VKSTYVRVAMVSLISAAIALNGSKDARAQSSNPPRKPMAESRLALPEYFGLYAVQDSGQMLVLDKPVEKLDERPTMTLSANVEFLIYGKDVDPSTIHIIAIPAAQPQQKQEQGDKPFSWDGWMQQTQVDGPQNFMAAMTGVPRGSREGRLLAKPVNNQPQMLRLIPSDRLPNGIYQIGTPEKQWYRFAVDGSMSTPTPQQESSAEPSTIGNNDTTPKKVTDQSGAEIPAAYGVYMAADAKTTELTATDVQTVFGLQPGGGSNRGFAVDGLRGSPESQTSDRRMSLIVYLPNINVGALQMGKLEYMQSLQASQFNIIRTAPQFFQNVYGKSPNQQVSVGLWRPARIMPVKIEPVAGQRDMYRIRSGAPLESGRYAVWFDKSLREADVVFAATPGANPSSAYWFEVK
jgi:hypothetical protein